MYDQNKALVREAFLALFNEGHLAAAEKAFAPDFVGHDPSSPGPVSGPQGVKNMVSTYRSAFPDMHLTIEDQIAEGDKVVTRWSARGTHKGELMGIPPTEKVVTMTGIMTTRIAGGKIEDAWENYDALGMKQQLGVVPGPNSPTR